MLSCHIPNDHMVAYDIAVSGELVPVLRGPESAFCSLALMAATGGCTGPHSAAKSAPGLRVLLSRWVFMAWPVRPSKRSAMAMVLGVSGLGQPALYDRSSPKRET